MARARMGDGEGEGVFGRRMAMSMALGGEGSVWGGQVELLCGAGGD
jgi:hypothetical protein